MFYFFKKIKKLIIPYVNVMFIIIKQNKLMSYFLKIKFIKFKKKQ